MALPREPLASRLIGPEAKAMPLAERLADLGIAWFEEPMPADDVGAHAALAAKSRVPVAVGESLYSLSQFKDYAVQGAMQVCQVDAARIGGITPWLKTAHLAEAHNLPVAPHFLMELHASLACAAAAGRWVEYIPQLDPITVSRLEIREGRAIPPETPGLGIDWDWDAVAAHAAPGAACEIS